MPRTDSLTISTTSLEPGGDGSGSSFIVLTMDDGKANALSVEMMAAISAAVTEAEADPAVKAVVLKGRPDRFCGGFDLSVMQSGDFPAIVELVSLGGDLISQIYGCGVPVIAANTGHAIAAGALLLMACDVRISVPGDYKIGLNEVAIGMTLPGWALTLARERLSPRHIQRAVANARITDPAGAVDAGFLDYLVPEDQLSPSAEAEAATLAQTLVPSAYAQTLKAFRSTTLATMATQIASDRAAVT